MPRSRSIRLAATIAALTVFAILAPAASAATRGTLIATVGPGFDITLKTRSGDVVKSVRAGSTWTIRVRDRSSDHNFRLEGPGAGRETDVAAVGDRRWTVTFRRGTWRFYCEPHELAMNGSFVAR